MRGRSWWHFKERLLCLILHSVTDHMQQNWMWKRKHRDTSSSCSHTTECFCFQLYHPPLSPSTLTIYHPFNRTSGGAPSSKNLPHHNPHTSMQKAEITKEKCNGSYKGKSSRMRIWGHTLQWGMKSPSDRPVWILCEGENDKLDWLAIMLCTRLVLSNACSSDVD